MESNWSIIISDNGSVPLSEQMLTQFADAYIKLKPGQSLGSCDSEAT